MTVQSRPGDWQAIYIFYSSDANPLLTECVAPLVRDLRERGLLAQWFFINYWLEGPHVRLRLRPASQECTAELKAAAESAIDAFLARRPALYEVDLDQLGGYYDDMFRLEYSEQERIEKYGADGPMPLRPNNSYQYVDYEPELKKYGGPAGVELAEWHFEHSSDLVLQLRETTNVHVRSVMLGLATQLMMIMSSCLLGGRDAIARSMDGYYHFWYDWFRLSQPDRDTRFFDNQASLDDDLHRRFDDIHDAIATRRLDRLSTFVADWAEHCLELRDRVADLASSGRLEFPPRNDWNVYHDRTSTERELVTDPEVALGILVSPYLHMTNNRLGATVMDEAYLSYLVAKTLDPSLPSAPVDAGAH